MSTRWMAVQYVGNTLRLPVVNEGDMGKPFGSSVLERDVKRIVVNPFSANPQTFVPESENVKLRMRITSLEAALEGMHLIRDQDMAENAKLRDAVATAIKVQTVLCGDADSLYCRNECPLHRPESNDCLACDVIGVAQELEIEVD